MVILKIVKLYSYILLLVLPFSVPAFGSHLPYHSLLDLVEYSDVILIGKTISFDENSINIKVSKSIYGKPTDPIVKVQPTNYLYLTNFQYEKSAQHYCADKTRKVMYFQV